MRFDTMLNTAYRFLCTPLHPRPLALVVLGLAGAPLYAGDCSTLSGQITAVQQSVQQNEVNVVARQYNQIRDVNDRIRNTCLNSLSNMSVQATGPLGAFVAQQLQQVVASQCQSAMSQVPSLPYVPGMNVPYIPSQPPGMPQIITPGYTPPAPATGPGFWDRMMCTFNPRGSACPGA
ncbi:MAG: hypothetical protein KGL39_21555 [Patescibacteria group bacterium]|nr:hypothetical protein [Patescibacteria group bacterium]